MQRPKEKELGFFKPYIERSVMRAKVCNLLLSTLDKVTNNQWVVTNPLCSHIDNGVRVVYAHVPIAQDPRKASFRPTSVGVEHVLVRARYEILD